MSNSDHFEVLMAGDEFDRIQTKKTTKYNKKALLVMVSGLVVFGVIACNCIGGFDQSPLVNNETPSTPSK